MRAIAVVPMVMLMAAGRSEERLVAVIRRGDALLARTSFRRESLGRVGPTRALLRESMHGEADSPLAEVSRGLLPDRDVLVAAWEALAQPSWDAGTLAAALLVALETTQCPEHPAPRVRPVQGPLSAQKQPPTAAHPRAFRGTKEKPPKSQRPAGIDLRPHISDPTAFEALRRGLMPDLHEALELLAHKGYDRDRLREAYTLGGNLGLHYRHPGASERLRELAPRLGVAFEIALRTWSTGQIEAAAPILAALNRTAPEGAAHLGGSEPPRRALSVAVGGLLLSAPPELALGWLRLLVATAPPRRLTLITLVLEAGPLTDAALAPERVGPVLAAFDAATTDATYAHRLQVLLSAVACGVDPRYLFTGFALADVYEPAHSFSTELPADARCDPEHLGPFLLRCEEPMLAWSPSFPLVIWEACGITPGLELAFATIGHAALEPETAFEVARTLLTVRFQDLSVEAKRRKWAVVLADLVSLISAAATVPDEYECKFFEDMRGYYWYWDEPEDLRRFLPNAHALAHRLARPPFLADRAAHFALASMIDALAPTSRERLLAMPDGSFRALERACPIGFVHRDLVAHGLAVLAKVAPALLLDALEHFPGKLVRVAEVLGSSSDPVASEVIARFGAHPLVSAHLPEIAPADALRLIRTHAPGMSNPMPRRLQRFAEGTRALTEAQVTHDQRILAERLPLLLLEIVEAMAYSAIAPRVALNRSDADIRHALRHVQSARENRRAYLRALREIAGGTTDVRQLHPANRAWLKRHPRLDIVRWTEGLNFVRDIPGVGAVRIAIERDPLEMLKIGTYAGTCVAAGGICSESAVVPLLDINKQVLYGRDERGNVVGRQVVAVSTTDTLVFYPVYPESAPPGVQEAFLDHAFAFSAAMDLEIAETREVEVELIVARRWWDDGVWEPLES